MGGTTAKACLVKNGQPETTYSFEVARVHRFKKGSGLPIRAPAVDLIEIGARGRQHRPYRRARAHEGWTGKRRS